MFITTTSSRVRLVARLGASIGGSQDRGDASAKVLAHGPDRSDAVARIEVVIGDDDVRRAERVERRHRLFKAMGGCDQTAPALQQSPQALKHAGLVVDGQNLEAIERLARGHRLGRARLRVGRGRRAPERRSDEEHRAIARARP